MRYFRTILISSCVLFFSAACGFGEITPDEALSKFAAAGTAYKEGKYEDAAKLYNDILEGGRESGAIYYNLGNVYYKMGNAGKTVLSYARAGQLIPRDRDLNFNDRYVLSKIDRHREENRGFPEGMINRHIQFYTRDEMVMIMTCLVFAMGILFLLSLYFHWPRSVARGMIVFLLFVFAAYAVGLAVKVQSEKGLAVAVAVGDAYFEPREDSTVHFKLPEGAKATILKSEGSWLKIRRWDGKVGWALRKNLSLVSKNLQ